MDEQAGNATKDFRRGATVECTVIQRSLGGYHVVVNATGEKGILTDPNPQSDFAVGTVLKTIFVGRNEVGEPLPVFNPKTEVDDFVDKMIMAEVSKLGLGLEDLANCDMNDLSAMVDIHQNKIDLETLNGDFNTCMIEIAKAWHDLDASPAESLLSRAQSDSSQSLLHMLHEAKVISSKQFKTLKDGKMLIDSGAIDFRMMAIGYRDELDGMCSLRESLQVRGWIS